MTLLRWFLALLNSIHIKGRNFENVQQVVVEVAKETIRFKERSQPLKRVFIFTILFGEHVFQQELADSPKSQIVQHISVQLILESRSERVRGKRCTDNETKTETEIE